MHLCSSQIRTTIDNHPVSKRRLDVKGHHRSDCCQPASYHLIHLTISSHFYYTLQPSPPPKMHTPLLSNTTSSSTTAARILCSSAQPCSSSRAAGRFRRHSQHQVAAAASHSSTACQPCAQNKQQQCTCGIVIVDHGSRRKASNEMLLEFCQLYQQMTQHPIVEPAHMEIAEPSIAQAIGVCVCVYWHCSTMQQQGRRTSLSRPLPG